MPAQLCVLKSGGFLLLSVSYFSFLRTRIIFLYIINLLTLPNFFDVFEQYPSSP